MLKGTLESGDMLAHTVAEALKKNMIIQEKLQSKKRAVGQNSGNANLYAGDKQPTRLRWHGQNGKKKTERCYSHERV